MGITSRLIAGAILLAVGLLSAPVTAADPNNPGQPGYCEPKADPFDCMEDNSPPSPAEQQFLNTVPGHLDLGAHPGQLLQYGRASCAMLAGGAPTWYVVSDLAAHLYIDQDRAGRFVDQAREDFCPDIIPAG